RARCNRCSGDRRQTTDKTAPENRRAPSPTARPSRSRLRPRSRTPQGHPASADRPPRTGSSRVPPSPRPNRGPFEPIVELESSQQSELPARRPLVLGQDCPPYSSSPRPRTVGSRRQTVSRCASDPAAKLVLDIDGDDLVEALF